jgi:hypothetical protein
MFLNKPTVCIPLAISTQNKGAWLKRYEFADGYTAHGPYINPGTVY